MACCTRSFWIQYSHLSPVAALELKAAAGISSGETLARRFGEMKAVPAIDTIL
jgi:hypothetical protein